MQQKIALNTLLHASILPAIALSKEAYERYDSFNRVILCCMRRKTKRKTSLMYVHHNIHTEIRIKTTTNHACIPV
jgi:hypothetical protein